MEKILRGQLLELAEAFSAATGIPASAIGSRAVNYSYFFERISDPKISLTLRTYDKVVAWFSANWPENEHWPSDVHRPGGEVVGL